MRRVVTQRGGAANPIRAKIFVLVVQGASDLRPQLSYSTIMSKERAGVGNVS